MWKRHFQIRLVPAFALGWFIQLSAPCWPQENPNNQDTTSCPSLKVFPPLPMSVVESCHTEDSVEVTLPLSPDANGLAREKRVRGAYEFREYHIPESDRGYAFESLMNLIPIAGFVVKYSNKPSTITARKGNTWMLINIGGESYNVSVVVVPEESWTSVKNAEAISREFKAHGRVEIYGINFSPNDQSIQEAQSDILFEILKYLKENPSVSLVIESHKFSTQGMPEDDSEITRERANAVMDWLIEHGVTRSRVQPRPCGRDNPLTDNESPAEIQRNERIALIKTNP